MIRSFLLVLLSIYILLVNVPKDVSAQQTPEQIIDSSLSDTSSATASANSSGRSTTSANKSNRVCTKVGNPTTPDPCLIPDQGIPIPGGVPSNLSGLAAILEWDSQIVNSLAPGLWGYLNRMLTNFSNNNYSTGTWPGTNEGSVYWCTYSIIDSYNLAGFPGLSKAAHAAVVNMRRFWRTEGVAKYNMVYVDYQTDNTSIANVKPGFAMFMETVDGVFTGKEHVNMIREISINAEGNGSFSTYDSNSSAKGKNYTVAGWRVLNPIYPVRGFGGI